MAQPLFSSDDTRKRRSRLAETLLMQGADASPVQHWTQGLARLSQAMTGGYLSGQLERDEKDRSKKRAALIASHPALAGATAPTDAPTTAERPEQPIWTAPGIPGVLPGAEAPTTPTAGTWHTRQNNPGNIRMTDGSLKAYPGAQPGQNGFLAFQTPEHGLAAIGQTFRNIAKTRGVNTLAGIISVYAPRGDGANDPTAYAAAVSKETGIPIDAPLNLDDPATMQRIIPALIRIETGKASPYTPQQIAGVGQSPGQPPAPVRTAQAPATTATDGGIPTRERDYIKTLIASEDPVALQMARNILQQYSQPSKFGFTTAGDQIYRTDSRTGKAEPIQGVTKPRRFGVIGKDQYGNDIHGWIDESKGTVTPGGPQTVQSQEDIRGRAQFAQSAQDDQNVAKPPPPNVDPKKWRELETERIAKIAGTKDMALQSAGVVLRNVDDVIREAKSNWWATGAPGAVASQVPGTPAFDMRLRVDTIKANIAFDALQRMRAASPTGGALGQVAVEELRQLQNSLAATSNALSKEAFLKSMGDVKQQYEAILKKYGGTAPAKTPEASEPAPSKRPPPPPGYR